MSLYQVDSFCVCTLYLNLAPADQFLSIKDPISPISKPEDDYFNLLILRDFQAAVLSPGWPRPPSVLLVSNMQPASSTLSSSHGSWTSLFNAGSMQHFMSGIHDSIAIPLNALSPRLLVVRVRSDCLTPNLHDEDQLEMMPATSTTSDDKNNNGAHHAQ